MSFRVDFVITMERFHWLPGDVRNGKCFDFLLLDSTVFLIFCSVVPTIVSQTSEYKENIR